MVADAGEQVLATAATVGKMLQPAGLQPADVIIMATCRGEAQQVHDGSPLRTMGPDMAAMMVKGDDMGDLMGNGAGQEILPMTFQEKRVVADHPGPPGLAPDLTRATAAQVEADFHPGCAQAKAMRRMIEDGPGFGVRQGDERVQGAGTAWGHQGESVRGEGRGGVEPECPRPRLYSR